MIKSVTNASNVPLQKDAYNIVYVFTTHNQIYDIGPYAGLPGYSIWLTLNKVLKLDE